MTGAFRAARDAVHADSCGASAVCEHEWYEGKARSFPLHYPSVLATERVRCHASKPVLLKLKPRRTTAPRHPPYLVMSPLGAHLADERQL